MSGFTNLDRVSSVTSALGICLYLTPSVVGRQGSISRCKVMQWTLALIVRTKLYLSVTVTVQIPLGVKGQPGLDGCRLTVNYIDGQCEITCKPKTSRVGDLNSGNLI